MVATVIGGVIHVLIIAGAVITGAGMLQPRAPAAEIKVNVHAGLLRFSYSL